MITIARTVFSILYGNSLFWFIKGSPSSKNGCFERLALIKIISPDAYSK
jgi:hypothetical protein